MAAGAMAVLPSGFLQILAEPLTLPLGVGLPRRAFDAFVVTAGSEEGLKLLALGLANRKAPAGLDPEGAPLEAARRGAWMGLGFALFEALFFLHEGPVAAAVRLGLAVPSHGLDGWVLGGYSTRSRGRALLLVMALHGSWDLGVFQAQAGEPLWGLLVPLVLAVQVCLALRMAGVGRAGIPPWLALPRPGARIAGVLRGLGTLVLGLGLVAVLGAPGAESRAAQETLVGASVFLALGAFLLHWGRKGTWEPPSS